MEFWDSKRLRERAKGVMTGHYWQMLLISLLCALATGAFGFLFGSGNFLKIGDLLHGEWYLPYVIRELLPSLSFTTIAVGTLGILYLIFVARPVEVGQCRYFTLCRYGEYEWKNTLFSFKEGRYMNIVTTLLVRDIKIFLWSLLFFIPGVVKSYEYFMVPYIMAENPYLEKERAFEISSSLTYGDKGRMFCIDLAFFGFYLLLAIATLGIGVIFLMPYHKAVRAELYGALRYKGAKTGVFTANELGAELF